VSITYLAPLIFVLHNNCTHANVLEIVLAVGMVTWTSYTSQIAKIKLDTQFEPKVWKKAS